nr:uclacyanin-3-like [Ipomoea batatas]
MAMATFVLLFLLLASPAAFAKDHVVGGDGGWSQSGDYTTWAGGETFTVGDNLVFNYGGSHGVAEVSKDDYDSCNAANALQSFSDGKTTIKLSKAGPMYFMCPTFGHCQTARFVDLKEEVMLRDASLGYFNYPHRRKIELGGTISVAERKCSVYGVVSGKRRKWCSRRRRKWCAYQSISELKDDEMVLLLETSVLEITL